MASTRQRIFFKKNKKSLPSACRVGTRQSDRQRGLRRDGRFSLPSAPGALDKVFAECPRGSRQSLCRVPDKRHSPKRALPINFLPCVLCRVPHSAKALSSAIWPLPSAIWPQALGKEPESSSVSSGSKHSV